jgi:hypothetical protein
MDKRLAKTNENPLKMNNQLQYFIDLLITSCEVPKEPLTIAEVMSFEVSRTHILNNIISMAKHDFSNCNWNRNAATKRSISLENPVGLNTIGMLADRLSILLIKKMVKNARNNLELKDQIDEIVRAIDNCQEGFSSTFNKITLVQDKNSLDHVVDITMHLAFVNLLLWLAQDVLYLRGAGSLANEELRAYIDYFANKNILRNQLIAQLAYYWHF